MSYNIFLIGKWILNKHQTHFLIISWQFLLFKNSLFQKCPNIVALNTITHGPLQMERSHSQNATFPTKCVGTLAHSCEIVPILCKPRGRQRT